MLGSEWHEHKVSFGLTPVSELWLAKLDGRVGVVVGLSCCVMQEGTSVMIEDLKLHEV